MVEFNYDNKTFQDIEMLEIPDDDDQDDSNISVSSDTDVISNSDSTDSRNSLFKSQAEYIELSDWLSNESSYLQFHFDSKKYKKSCITNMDNFQQQYISYIKSLYKIIETLTKSEAITRVEQDDDESPIGLITNSTPPSINQKSIKINESFQQIQESLSSFIQSTTNNNDIDEEAEKLRHLQTILQCLAAHYFATDIRTKPDSILEWVNTYDPKPDKALVEQIMINTPKPYEHPQFWNVLISQYITRGLFQQLHEAIYHSKFEELQDICPELYGLIIDLDTLIQDYQGFCHKGQFTQWKLLMCEFRDSFASRIKIKDSKYQIIAGQIFDLVCILTGLPKSIASYCDNWYDVYLALVLYQVRDENDNQELYKEYFQMAINEKPSIPTSSSSSSSSSNDINLDQLVENSFLNILDGKFLKVLESLYILEPATAAYISLLFDLKSLFETYYTSISHTHTQHHHHTHKSISEYFLVRHAYEALNIHPLVPVGIGLLRNPIILQSSNSNLNSTKVIADFLPNYTCTTNDDLEWTLTICADMNLIKTARELYYNAGLKSLGEGYIYESLHNFANSYDPNSRDNKAIKQIHYVVWDMIFADALVHNRPIKDILVNNLILKRTEGLRIAHPVIQQCLAPYAVLYEYFTEQEEECFGGSEVVVGKRVRKLIHLLKHNYMPKKFVPLLLCQFLPFFKEGNRWTLADLVMIIELVDGYENDSTPEDADQGQELYAYSITNVDEDEAREYDWRKVLGADVPHSVDEMLRYLRNKVVGRIGRVYLE